MRWENAQDIKDKIKKIVSSLSFDHIDASHVITFRSFGSKSKARARIWSLPRVWQQALEVPAHYVIEVLSERFDRLSPDDKERVLIHELLHIPKSFSGSLTPHRGRYHRIDSRLVEKLYKQYKYVSNSSRR